MEIRCLDLEIINNISCPNQYLLKYKSEPCWNQLPLIRELIKMNMDSLSLMDIFQDFIKDVVQC